MILVILMADRKVRGVVLDAYFKAIKKHWGKQGVDKCAEYVGVHPDEIKKRMWYPAEYHTKMHRWIGDKAGPKYVTIAGSFSIKNMGFLSYLARFISVKTLLKKAPKSFEDAYNFGTMKVEVDEEKKEALAKLKGVVIDKYSCYGWKGVFVGALEATKTGGNVKIIDHPDKGDKDCFLEISWK